MSFLYPAFLVAALAAAVPVVLHLLRRDAAPEVPFTAVRLLRRAPVERSRRRRLRDLLLLAARVAAILLLAAAFARPYATAGTAAGLRVIAIDRSFSMSAPGVFERARAAAREAIDDARAGERVALIALDDRAELVARPGTAADARGALDALAPGFGATRYAALAERTAALDDGVGGTLVVVTDLQRSGWDREDALSLPPGWDLQVRATGRTAGNLAIVDLRAEPDRVVATIRNDWPVRRTGGLRIEHDGRGLGEAAYDIPPAATADIAVAARSPHDGGLSAAINDPEGLEADNARFLVLGGGAGLRALMVVPSRGAQGGFYLARALGSATGEHAIAVDVMPASSRDRGSIDSLRGHALIILTSTRGLERRTREAIAGRVREGAGLFVTASPEMEAAVLSAMFGWKPAAESVAAGGAVTLAATDPRHPVFRPFGPLLANLGQVRVERTWRVPEDGWRVPARFSDGTAALLERREGSGRVVLFASDLDRRWNDFPLHPAFVPFAVEAARFAAPAQGRHASVLVADTPDGLDQRPGLQRRPFDGREVAVNVDIRESDPASIPADEFAGRFRTAGRLAQATRLHAVQVEAGQAYWRYGLLLMLGVLVAESLAGRVRPAG